MTNISAVILCGGYGTRITELTKSIPKPMIKINKKPIFIHIMEIYLKFGVRNFHLALGYKYEEFIKFFYKKNYNKYLKIIRKKKILELKTKLFNKNLKIYLHNTGKDTLTGGRLKRLKKYLNNTFFLTYGDGLANVNIKKLYNFHIINKKKITVTAVRPAGRFGVLKIKGNKVTNFKEKPQVSTGWINGGFFVIEPKFLNLIANDKTILEKEPLEKAAKEKSMLAFKHKGFWHCIDTLRDKIVIDEIVKSKGKIWLK